MVRDFVVGDAVCDYADRDNASEEPPSAGDVAFFVYYGQIGRLGSAGAASTGGGASSAASTAVGRLGERDECIGIVESFDSIA